MLHDDFNYASTADILNAYPVHTSSADAYTTLVPGMGGAGGAMQLAYGPSTTTAMKIGPEWALRGVGTWNGTLPEVAPPYDHFFFSAWFRTTPGWDPTVGTTSNGGLKGFMFYHANQGGADDTDGGRIEVGPSRFKCQSNKYGFATIGSSNENNCTGDDIYKTVPGPLAAYAGQVPYWSYFNDGNWHHITFEIRTAGGPDGYTTTTGGMRIWVDGTFIFDNTGFVLEPNPGQGGVLTKPGSLDNFAEPIEYWAVFGNGWLGSPAQDGNITFDNWTAWVPKNTTTPKATTGPGGSIVLTGRGFGNVDATPAYFQTYDSQSLGTTAGATGLDGKDVSYPAPLVADSKAHSGSNSLYKDYNGTSSYPKIAKSINNSTDLYMGMWFYWSYAGGTPNIPVFKLCRANSGALYFGNPSFHNTVRPRGGTVTGGDTGYVDGSSIFSTTRPYTGPSAGHWYWMEYKWRLSTPGVDNGLFQWLVNGKLNVDDKPATTREAGNTGTIDWAVTPFDGLDKRGADNISYKLWTDDLVISPTFARVILTNAENYSQSTDWEPEDPTAWNNTEVTIAKPSWGDFASGSTVYFHVFDANDSEVAVFPSTVP